MTEISVATQRRLLKDVRDMIKHPLTDEGIYYIHDEDNMLKGYAMIIGPPNSPYEHGFFMFEFTFPVDYPFNPPEVKYMTNDGNTRFHPNLYTNGKVCLSILNTWAGEQWSSSQSIRSILMTLRSLFDWKALSMEPGVQDTNPYVKMFDDIIQVKTIEHAMIANVFMCMKNSGLVWSSFLPFMNKYITENRDKIDNYILEVEKKFKEKYKYVNGKFEFRFYSRKIPYSFKFIREKWHEWKTLAK